MKRHINETQLNRRLNRLLARLRVLAVGLVPSVFLSLSGSAAAATTTLEKIAETGEITLGYQIAPPFALLDQNKPVGYSIDLCMKLVDAIKRELRRNELKVNFSKVTNASRWQALSDGSIDLECGNSTNTAAAREKVAFTIPTYFATTRMMVKEGSGIAAWPDLKGKRLSMITGSTAYNLYRAADETRNFGAVQANSDDYEGAHALMESDKVDAFIMDDVLLAAMRVSTKSKTMYVLTPSGFSVEALALAMRKNDPRFKKLVDDELTKLIQQGVVTNLYRRWFQSPIPPANYNLRLPMSYILTDSFKSPTDWVPN